MVRWVCAERKGKDGKPYQNQNASKPAGPDRLVCWRFASHSAILSVVQADDLWCKSGSWCKAHWQRKPRIGR
jgi:hypothetical protein